MAFVSLLSFHACSDDFITAVSPDQIPIEEYYSTEARIFEALVASYAPLQWPDWNGSEYNPSLIMSDIMADDFWVGGAGHSDNMEWHLMANFKALPERVIKGVWSCYYSGVNRANNVIEYMDYVKNISSENRALYIAEAKVLRSFYFTYLWKMWGNIAYHKKNLEFPYIGEQERSEEYTSELQARETRSYGVFCL